MSTLPTCPLPEKTTTDHQLAALDACIHCGLCLPACPTYRVTGSEAESPRGRLYLMKGMLQGDERMTPDAIAPHIDQCLGCMACQTACPSGVEYGALLDTTRQTLLNQTPCYKRWFRRMLYQHVLPNRALLRLGTTALNTAEKVGLFWLGQSWLNPIKLLRRLAAMQPKVANLSAGVSGNPSWHAYQQALSMGGVITPKEKLVRDCPVVGLFAGCVMDAWFARVHAATITALVANGYAVWVPKAQTCCGALAHHAGETDIAHALESKNDQVFSRYSNLKAVVVNSAGCGSSMAQWNVPTIDIMALLDEFPLNNALSSLAKSDGSLLRVAYHAACHLHHAQGVQQAPLNILSQLPGVAQVALNDADLCCGSAGVYNVAHPQLADAILAEKLATLNPEDVDVLVTGNPGCLLQWQAGLRAKGINLSVHHPIELLAKAYGDVAMAVWPESE